MLVDGTSSDLESHLRRAAKAGTEVDLRSGDPQADNPDVVATWLPGRTLRAEFLAGLLTERSERLRVVCLTGARISGALDLRHAVLSCPVFLKDCSFDSPVDLSRAETQMIRMVNCRVPTITAHQVRAHGDIDLSDTVTTAVAMIGAHIEGQLVLDGTKISNPGEVALHAELARVEQGVFGQGLLAKGEICLIGGRIGGYLNFAGATLSNHAGTALNAQRVSVDQDVYCDDGFTAEGEVRFTSASLRGQFSLRTAKLSNPGGFALEASGIVVDQEVCLHEGFSAIGEVSLQGGRIGGFVRLDGAKLSNPNGCALNADSIKTGQSVRCDSCFTSEGEVSLCGAHVGGQLTFDGARLSNPGGCALSAVSLSVDYDMSCNDGFLARGEITLVSAHLRRLSFSGASLCNEGQAALSARGITVDRGTFFRDDFSAMGAIRLENAHIGGQLDFTDATLTNPEKVALGLSGARINVLTLLPRERPEGIIDLTNVQVGTFQDAPETWPTKIQIRGFVYENLVNDRIHLSRRLDWLTRHTDGYAPSLYDQLAAAYRRAGHIEDARRVAFAKQLRRRSELNRPGKLWNWLLYVTVGYGYRPWLAFGWLIVLLALGSTLFALTYPADFVPASGSVPSFHPIAYALDVLLPVVDLGQQKAWLAQGGSLVWSWILVATGWILAALIIAGITNAIKRD